MGNSFLRLFAKGDVQDSRTNRFRVKIEVVTMLGLFWRCIPMVSKTLKSKYSANFMFSRETCFSLPAWSAAESSRSLEGKSHLQLIFHEEWPERAAVTQHSWLSPAPARTPGVQGGDRGGTLQPGSVTQLLELLGDTGDTKLKVWTWQFDTNFVLLAQKAVREQGRGTWKMLQIGHDFSSSVSQSFMASKEL